MSLDWPTVRARIIDAFDGELPGATLETTIVDLYQAHPQAVIDAYPGIATQLAAGKLNSGWAVLKKAAVERATRQTNPTVTREKLIRNADQWLRNAGLMYDRWDEVHDELFGDQGRLRTIKTDKLVERYHDAWQTVRPDGLATELEHEQRLATWKTQHDQLAKPKQAA